MHEKGLDGVRKSVRIPTRYDVRDDVFRQSKAEEQKSLRDDSVVLKNI